jgi:hypothetical protein
MCPVPDRLALVFTRAFVLANGTDFGFLGKKCP